MICSVQIKNKKQAGERLLRQEEKTQKKLTCLPSFEERQVLFKIEVCAYVIRCFVEEITVGENWEMIFCCWSMVLVKPKSMLLIGWVLSIHRIK